MALSNPENFVMKPQREGGGLMLKNFFFYAVLRLVSVSQPETR